MKISSPTIDGKVCSGSHAALASTKSTATTYVDKYVGSSSETEKTSQCSGLGSSSANKEHKFLSKFVELTKIGEGKNWPTGVGGHGSKSPENGDPNSNADAMAKDLVNLNRDEKTIVAGLLAKTIEGGEVVEIRAVSSTSVMVNACYDLLSEGLGVVPYACVGLGGNFVGVVDEYSTIRPS
ncbi:surface antigen family protein [Anaplasma phagocytophilum str. ApNP]|uniref:Surface antigen family protein n=1 Tax=Anaplasma phagocytophilum str. ApNP TaxID=1359153 RepID=A0A0F3NFW9_ANAPH|nr:surface antigen family protein [Anaplasma phagocytophilum str. ApNP]